MRSAGFVSKRKCNESLQKLRERGMSVRFRTVQVFICGQWRMFFEGDFGEILLPDYPIATGCERGIESGISFCV